MLKSAFEERKELVRAWLSGQLKGWDGIEELPLDKSIVCLVRALNEQSFLYTMGSCGGHVHAAKSGDASFSGSWFTFTVDGSDDGMRFLEALRKLIEKHEGASCEVLKAKNSYAAVLARQPENRYAITIRKAKQLRNQTKELIEKIILLAQTKSSL